MAAISKQCEFRERYFSLKDIRNSFNEITDRFIITCSSFRNVLVRITTNTTMIIVIILKSTKNCDSVCLH